MEFDPGTLPIAHRYRLLVGGIVPRPIAFVSTISPDGLVNLAPYSFFNGVGSDPMSLLFCALNKSDGAMKDTLRHVLPPAEGGTGEFVVNVATEAYARSITMAGEPLSYGESEFVLTGLTPIASTRVRAPRVLESPIAYECETMQVVRIAEGTPGGSSIVIGRVVLVHVRDDMVDGSGQIDCEQFDAIGVVGKTVYCRTTDRFES